MRHSIAGALIWLGILALGAPSLGAFDIVRDGAAEAEIVVPEGALPQVAFAARELRDHILEMSGAALPIVHAPTGGKKPIHVGESEHTKALGLTTADLKMEGFRIVVADEYMALIGRDAVFPQYPRGHTSPAVRDRLLAEWQEFCGEKWDFPFLQIYDPRNYNPELGFSLYDPTGTLFAVYDLLEGLGVRWYMPYHDFGTIIPKAKDISVGETNTSREPVFSRRYLRFCWANNTPGFLWFKRQKLGMSEMAWIMHGTSEVTHYTHDEHPEYLAQVGGVVQKSRGKRGNRAIPRLAPPLRDAMAGYIDKFFERYPEMNIASAGPADAYTSIDDRDAAAGWLREERGRAGRLSDYVWTFVNDVAMRVAEKHPDKTVMGLAYSFYRQPPEDIDKFHYNVGVCYCQHRSRALTPEDQQQMNQEREAWLDKMVSDEFYVWEYFLWPAQLRGVPIFFPTLMSNDMKALSGQSKGEYVEAYAHGDNWGLWHPTYYLQARMYWEPGLDVDRFLDEYCEQFYGPAADDMREFLAFAEEVWVRPEPRQITRTGGFLKQADVDRYFAILERAKARAGDSVYGKRIDLIIEECQPMKAIFDNLQRIEREGPDFSAPRIAAAPTIDGDLSDACWTDEDGGFRQPSYLTHHLHTEELMEPRTTAMLRWADDDSGLYVAVACDEPEMDKLNPQVRENDSFSIFDNDVVEIFLETPERSAFRAAINVNEAIYDACTDPNVQPGGVDWDSGWDFAVKKEANRWNVELFISRESLDNAAVPSNDDPWGINVCRTRFITGKAENSAISPTHGRFFTVSKFGSVIVED